MPAMTLLVALAVAIAGPSPPTDSAALDPTGKWVIDYQEGSCLLSRTYGGEGTTLGFRPVPAGDRVQLVVAAKGAERSSTSGNGRWWVDANGPVVADYTRSALPYSPLRITVMTTDVGARSTRSARPRY